MEIPLQPIDIAIIVGYIAAVIAMGWFLSKRASKDLNAYFLGGKSLPWWVIGTSHGASGFDITGTMWFVTMLFTYGLRAAFAPWIWPLFDRIFRQVYLGAWIRKSNVLTGAEWMRTRFGTGRGGTLSHISVVIYAVLVTIGFVAYALKGIGKFADVFFPWDLAWGPLSSAESYGIVILSITTAYLLFGGWYSVVLTDLLQFALLTVASIFIAAVAMAKVSPEMLAAVVPDGWDRLIPEWRLGLDWSGHIAGLNDKIYGTATTAGDGYTLLGCVVMMWLLRGILVSAGGPSAGYGMQHQLSTRNPREAALENWWMSIVQLAPRSLMIGGIAILGLAFFSPQVNEMVAGGGKFDFEQILPFVIARFVPAGLTGILMAGLLAAFMSTFDSTVNAGAAYVVNDIYKRYIRPDAPNRRYVLMGYFWSVALVVVAVVASLRIENIDKTTKWITGLLYAGYIAPNVLKWHWWRFNGYGYFAGMIAGACAALAFPHVNHWIGNVWGHEISANYAFLVLVPVGGLASILACLLTAPDDPEVLKSFYRTVRPWGFWKPVLDELRKDDPSIEPNRNFALDMFNVANGILWQLALMVAPFCLVVRKWDTFWLSLGVLAVTSVIMKFTWYDRLAANS
ncbi:MAG: Na+:solute symporter [Sedimentisphaerales bacterium]|nr:Na+:solute symporter [Sedimentisphaerales bacterium]